MRQLILLFILFSTFVYGLERESTIKLYEEIFSALSPKSMINVYTNDKEYQAVFRFAPHLKLVEKAEEADIILITNELTLESILKEMNLNKKMKLSKIFVTNYHFLKKSKAILGAFYWRKGRSQLLFIQKRLEIHDIVLPPAYRDFMIETL